MNGERPTLLTFQETYFARIWGGRRLGGTLGRDVPEDSIIGEAWLISDHDECQSIVDTGPWAGKTLGQLMSECPDYLLGSHAKATPRGQFPLLLKLIDAGEALSVQVHPDDATALRLGEPDVGKTEMWHVLEADPGAELVCGLVPETTRDTFAAAVAEGRVERCMTRFPAPPGTSVFVPAGTVHAIGAGILLAEIQQNSNITYRVHDWNRVDASGQPRQLHLVKAMEAIDFHGVHTGSSPQVTLTTDGKNRRALGVCRYFAAERLEVKPERHCVKGTGSFHLVMAATGTLTVLAGDAHVTLRRGAAALVPGSVPEYMLKGDVDALIYYVPGFVEDILERFAATRRMGDSDPAFQSLLDWEVPAESIALLDATAARLYRVIPLGLHRNLLYLATAAPYNLRMLDNLARLTDNAVEPVPVSDEEITAALARYYPL